MNVREAEALESGGELGPPAEVGALPVAQPHVATHGFAAVDDLDDELRDTLLRCVGHAAIITRTGGYRAGRGTLPFALARTARMRANSRVRSPLRRRPNRVDARGSQSDSVRTLRKGQWDPGHRATRDPTVAVLSRQPAR
jgi:hypothetical protein